MRHAAAVAQQVQAILNGSTEPDPTQHGLTSEEERVAAQLPQVCSTRALTLCV